MQLVFSRTIKIVCLLHTSYILVNSVISLPLADSQLLSFSTVGTQLPASVAHPLTGFCFFFFWWLECSSWCGGLLLYRKQLHYVCRFAEAITEKKTSTHHCTQPAFFCVLRGAAYALPVQLKFAGVLACCVQYTACRPPVLLCHIS